MVVGCMNVHLVNEAKREAFIRMVDERLHLTVCGVVETWLKDEGVTMQEVLRGRKYSWFGKDRVGRRGGGIGVVVASSLTAKVAKPSRSEIFSGWRFAWTVYGSSGLCTCNLKTVKE